MGCPKTLQAVVVLLAIAAVSATGVDAAPDLTTLYSTNVAKAAFAGQYAKVWNYIEPGLLPGQRGEVDGPVRRGWPLPRDRPDQAASSWRIHASAWSTKILRFGNVRMIDVTVAVYYTLPHKKTLHVGLEHAYWVKVKGKWYAVWLPSQYSAYKAGKCSEPSLY